MWKRTFCMHQLANIYLYMENIHKQLYNHWTYTCHELDCSLSLSMFSIYIHFYQLCLICVWYICANAPDNIQMLLRNKLWMFYKQVNKRVVLWPVNISFKCTISIEINRIESYWNHFEMKLCKSNLCRIKFGLTWQHASWMVKLCQLDIIYMCFRKVCTI